jgi:hypothetical protein
MVENTFETSKLPLSKILSSWARRVITPGALGEGKSGGS